MARMRLIGTTLDDGYRDDLNFNFGLLEALIGESNGLTEALRQEMLEKIYNLQTQIDMLTGENIGELLARLNDAIQQALTAAQEARTAKTATEEATALAIAAKELAIASATLADEKAVYAEGKAILAQEAADNANQESANLSQLKINVVQATQDANEGATNANDKANLANNAAGRANQAADNADTSAKRANAATEAIEGWGTAEQWVNDKQYVKNNIVTDNGSTWQALRPNTGVTPVEGSEWTCLAKKGTDGTGAVSSVNNRFPDTYGNVEVKWSDVPEKPTTFPPATHTHEINDVTGLQNTLDSKASETELNVLMNLSPSVLKIPLASNYRGWQGVTVYNNLIYVVTDRDENFDLENIISVYSLDGKLVSEKRNAYTGLDPQGKFMSFGDANVIDDKMYVAAYNSNDGGTPLISRIVKYSLPDLSVINTYEIGGNVAESVTKHDNTYWVAYHDIYKVRRFDLDFNLIQEYDLPKDVNSGYTGGGPQGSLWEGNYYYVNIHGHNSIADTPYTELRKYEFNGTKFTYLESIEPPTVGSGQGLSKYGEYYFWNDRPGNYITITKSLVKANVYAEVMPILPQQTVEPTLLNGFTRWDALRTPRITLHNGVVYLSGMMRAPTDFIADGNPSKIAFFIPEQLAHYLSKNFTVTTNKGAVRVALAGTMDTTNGRRVVLGDFENPISGITWVAFDGINYPLLS